MAGAVRKTGLDSRITLSLLSWSPVMRGPGRILLAVMAVTAFLSMWVSTPATTAMMLSIGGIATIVGSPPNAIAVGILSESNVADLDFVGWMRFGLPVSIAGLAVAWCLFMVIQRPRIGDTAEARAAALAHRAKPGRLNVEEVATLGVFGFVILLWVTRPFWTALLPASVCEAFRHVNTHIIGLIGAVLLFIIPVRRRGWRPVLDWRDAKYLDWGVLVLFGGAASPCRTRCRPPD